MSTGRQTIAAVESLHSCYCLAAARPAGGRTAQLFSDCAITKYLSRATARRPPNNAIVLRPVLTEALLNNPGLQGTPAARLPTVASPVARQPSPRRTASIQAPAAATVLIGRTTVLQCCALLPVCLRFLHTVKHFRIVWCPLWLYRAITSWHRHA